MKIDHAFFYENLTIDQAIKEACEQVYNRITSTQIVDNLQINGNVATSYCIIHKSIKSEYIFFITEFNSQYLRVEICRK